MSDLFLKLLNTSISASYLAAAVVLLRLLFKKAPKWLWPVLWGAVALRLLVPVSIESRLSLQPSAQPIPSEIAYVQQMPAAAPSLEIPAAAVETVPAAPAPQPAPVFPWVQAGAWLWVIGAAAMAMYSLISYVNLRRRVRGAARLEGNVYKSRAVDSPFVLGLIRPRIYLPSALGEEETYYVLAHERAHIRRRDHWWKPLGFALLSLHWFNPVLWLSYILLCRDIELACDEHVIKSLGRNERADYSQALLSCTVRRRAIAACPLAFGEVGVKQRVKSVLSYKKPAFWIVAAAVIAGIVLSVCFLTDPRDESTLENGVYRVERIVYDAMRPDGGGAEVIEQFSFAVSDQRALYVRAEEAGEWQYVGPLEAYPETREKLLSETADLWVRYSPDEITDAYLCPMEEDAVYGILQTKDGDTLIGMGWRSEDRIDWPYLARLKLTREQLDKKQLTLDEVLELSKKGMDLGWEDFAGYASKDIGFGLYVVRYPMEAPFSLRITAGNMDEEPQSIRLCCELEDDACVDIRNGDLDAFLAIHGGDPMPAAADHWGLSLGVDYASPTGASVSVYRDTRSPAGVSQVCDAVLLQTKKGGSWVDVPKLEGAHDGAFAPLNHFDRRTVSWEDTYGALPDGEYRLGKWVTVSYGEDLMDWICVWQEFQLHYQEKGGRILTAQDVIRLSEKGWDLSWSDFEDFAYIQTEDPDLPCGCARLYEMEGHFYLYIIGESFDKQAFNVTLNCELDGEGWCIRHAEQGWAESFLSQHAAPLEGPYDHFGITFQVESCSPAGVRLRFRGEKPDGTPYRAGNQYRIERFNDSGFWEEVPTLEDNPWGQEAFHTTLVCDQDIDWTDRYGLLPAGHYRIGKRMYDASAYYYVEFDIVETNPDRENLSMFFNYLSPVGCEVIVAPSRGTLNGTLQCGDNMILQRRDLDGAWIDLPMLDDTCLQSDSFRPATEFRQFVYWTKQYGSLPDGDYRMVKWVWMDYGDDWDRFQIAGEFTLKTRGGRKTVTTSDIRALQSLGRAPTWEDLEDFAYTDVFTPQYPYASVIREYETEGRLRLVVTCTQPGPEPRHWFVYCKDDPEEFVILELEQQESFDAFLRLHDRPLPAGRTTHWDLGIQAEDPTPTGVTLKPRGSAPAGFPPTLLDGFSLERKNSQGDWETVPSLDGSEPTFSQDGNRYGEEIWPEPVREDWTDRFGPLPAGTYRLTKEVNAIMTLPKDGGYRYASLHHKIPVEFTIP